MESRNEEICRIQSPTNLTQTLPTISIPSPSLPNELTQQALQTDLHTSTQIQPILIHVFHPILIQKTFSLLPNMTLIHLRQLLAETSLLFLFQNYHLLLSDGTKPSDYLPLSTLLPQNQPPPPLEIQLKVILQPFQERTSKAHLKSVLTILENPPLYSFLSQQTHPGVLPQNKDQISSEQTPLSVEEVFSLHFIPSEFQIGSSSGQSPFLLEISLSSQTPSPSNLLSGHLYYLHVITLENLKYQIVASPLGFAVKKEDFLGPPHISFIELLKSISKGFTQLFQKETHLDLEINWPLSRLSLHPRTSGLNWLIEGENEKSRGNGEKKELERIRKEIGSEEIGRKDWNELFQITKELGMEGVSTVSRIYDSFEEAAINGARGIIEGKLGALNPMDEPKKWIYIHDNIFFSIADETPFDHSQEKGEDATPSASGINSDLVNLGRLHQMQLRGELELHILHMILVKFRGFTIIAQSIIPGILSGNQSNCNQYGSIDEYKTIETNPKFHSLMEKLCEQLGLETDLKIKDGSGEIKTIAGSPEIKGILGSDRRKYILDLLRLSPRDLNFLGNQNEVCVLRPELIQAYKMKYQASHPNPPPLPKLNPNIGTDIPFQAQDTTPQQQQLLKDLAAFLLNDAIPSLCRALQSNFTLCDSRDISRIFHQYGINMRYLGRVYSHPSLQQSPQIKTILERTILVKSMKHLFHMAMRDTHPIYLPQMLANLLNCAFLPSSLLPNPSESWNWKDTPLTQNPPPSSKNHSQPTQESGLTETNKPTKKKKKRKNAPQNEEFKQESETRINETRINSSPPVTWETISIPKSKYISMTMVEFWSVVRKLALCRFDHTLSGLDLEPELFKSAFQKTAALRDLCLTIGLVLETNSFSLSTTHLSPPTTHSLPLSTIHSLPLIQSPHSGYWHSSLTEQTSVLIFSPKNIVTLQAKSKKMKLSCFQGENLCEMGQKAQEEGKLDDAIRFYESAFREIENFHGNFVGKLAVMKSKISKNWYQLGNYEQAIYHQSLALKILAALGESDSPLAIDCYATLGPIYLAKNDFKQALYYLSKAVYLSLIAYGETYPNLTICLLNLARTYTLLSRIQEAIQTYEKALTLFSSPHSSLHNNFSLSLCQSGMASAYALSHDFQKAVEAQKSSIHTLQTLLPSSDQRLIDAKTILGLYESRLPPVKSKKN